ncbi:Flp family type IVb pilin [Burkholderia metallica]|uniref:Flp family type IVb pilin n=1 Tax=Burkholderia metallica TaxID=488729 RepID=UPI0020C669E4|nr:pilus assembly protein [Burkholderia metallica]
MTEYIVIVALIAVSAIGVYSFFGRTLRAQTSAMANAMAGDPNTAKSMNDDAKTNANTSADKAKLSTNLSNYGENSKGDGQN